MAITFKCALNVSLLCLASIGFAADPAPEVKLAKGSEVILVDEMSSRNRKFLRYDDGILLVQQLDSRQGRYEQERIPLHELSELRVVRRDRPEVYPMVGGLVLGAIGAGLGASATPDQTEDDGESDIRPYAAVSLGLLGFVVGYVTGAEIAPETRSETVVWSRN